METVFNRVIAIPCIRMNGIYNDLILFVNPLKFKDDRSCAINTTFNHRVFILRPALHDRATLLGGIDITADAVPGFCTKLAVHHLPEIFLVNDEFLTILE